MYAETQSKLISPFEERTGSHMLAGWTELVMRPTQQLSVCLSVRHTRGQSQGIRRTREMQSVLLQFNTFLHTCLFFMLVALFSSRQVTIENYVFQQGGKIFLEYCLLILASRSENQLYVSVAIR
jgi:hypothetical protein